MKLCHDYLFGAYCRDVAKHYYYEHPAVAEEVIANNLFIDSYNQYHEIEIHQKTRRLIAQEQLFPPACVEENSYNFVIDWLNYKKNKGFIHKDVGHLSKLGFSLWSWTSFSPND